MDDGGNPPVQPYITNNPNDPRIKAYRDSLNLYKAYQMQDKLMGPGNKVMEDVIPKSQWSHKELEEYRIPKYSKTLNGMYSRDWVSEQDMKNAFHPGEEKASFNLIKYYKSLGFTDKDIEYHTSPDVVSDKIRPIGTYWDGAFNSPIYKKPEQQVILQKDIPKEHLNLQTVPSQHTPLQTGLAQADMSTQVPHIPLMKETPTNYVATYRDDNQPDQTGKKYFQNKEDWESFINSPKYKFTNTSEISNGATSAGYLQKEKKGGEMKKLNKMGNGGKAYGNKFITIPYSNGDNTGMNSTQTIDLTSKKPILSANGKYINAYNAVDNNGTASLIYEDKIPSQYLNNKNNYAVTTYNPNNTVQKTDSLYLAPGADTYGIHLPPHQIGGSIPFALPHELVMYHMAHGGPVPHHSSHGGNQMQHVQQQVAQMLQQGVNPQQVLAQLVKSGMPQQQAVQLVQAVAQQMQQSQQQQSQQSQQQQQGSQQQMQQQDPSQGQQPQMEFGGEMLHNINIPKYGEGDEFTTDINGVMHRKKQVPMVTGMINPVIPNPINGAGIKPLQNNTNPGLSGTDIASGIIGGLNMFANQLNKIPDGKVNDMLRQRGTSDSQFQTFTPSVKRGFIDQNTQSVVPDQQVTTQFANQYSPNYYGHGNMLPIMTSRDGGVPMFGYGGSNLPDIQNDPSLSPSISQGFQPAPVPLINEQQANSLSKFTNGIKYGADNISFMGSKSGSISVRNNNPGNMMYSSFTKKFGAVPGSPRPDGQDGNYAAFPNVENGLQAQLALLTNKNYANLPVEQAINRWITGNANISGAYTAATINPKFVGRKIKDLSSEELLELQKGIIKNEDGTLYKNLKKQGIFRKGGEYKIGGEYDLHPTEIAKLKALGYQIKELS